ncbi:MAG: ECF-type sigma factor [Holophagales bacterium]|nr:ECF-type sigma factor [Holophagales bacterium]
MSDRVEELTRLLRSWSEGDPEGLDRLVPLVIDDLRRLARQHLRRLGSTPTLQPTAIVNEAYLRLARRQAAAFPSRSHFYAFASKLIRDLLVDHLRRHRAAKRGDGRQAEPLSDATSAPGTPLPAETVLEVHDLLSTLERRDPRRGRVVELRYFAGLTVPEIATVTGRSVATVERDWQVARRWLAKEMGAGG